MQYINNKIINILFILPFVERPAMLSSSNIYIMTKLSTRLVSYMNADKTKPLAAGRVGCLSTLRSSQ